MSDKESQRKSEQISIQDNRMPVKFAKFRRPFNSTDTWPVEYKHFEIVMITLGHH